MEYFNIEHYLPQKHPFIFVDKILDGNEKFCITSFSVEATNILLSGSQLSEAGILENVAQTCASHIGYAEIHIRHNPVKIGVVGTYKNFVIHRLPHIGENLHTHAEELENFDTLSIYTAKTMVGDEVVAEGEIHVALTEDIC